MAASIKTGFWYDAGEEATKCAKAGLGNCVVGVTSTEEAALCRRKKMHFIIPDLYDHGLLKIPGEYLERADDEDKVAFAENLREQIKRIKDAGGEFYAGLSILHEYGGRVYWPRRYLEPSTADSPRGSEGDYLALPPADNLADAKRIYLADLKKIVQQSKAADASPLILLCSSALHKYHLEAGVDIPGLEMFAGDVYLHVAAIRGAAKAFRRPWCAGSAMVCQGGGVDIDRLWFKRYQLSLFYAYLAGADIVVTQYGAFGLSVRRDPARRHFGHNSSRVKEHRRIAIDFHSFCQTHPRSKNGPKTALGIVHGHLDGNAGLWTKWVWGQRGSDRWKHAAPEFGWDYLDLLFRREDWHWRTLEGKKDFSGNPPYGQYDIVPIESRLAQLKKYKGLLFLGWNTMTREIYEKLKSFVRAGGLLVMAVPHLSTATHRVGPVRLYNTGDFRDLFGVVVKGKGPLVTSGHKFMAPAYSTYRFPEWGVSDPLFINGEYPLAKVSLKGAQVLCRSSETYSMGGARFSSTDTPEKQGSYPVLVENRLGKGKALLITSWCYPGHRGMGLLMRQLIRDISAYLQGNIRLAGSDNIRYAVYEEKDLTTVYLLNTDLEVPCATNLWIGNKMIPDLIIPSCEMRIAYLYKSCCVIPGHRSVHVHNIGLSKGGYQVLLEGQGTQTIDIFSLKAAFTKARFNGKPLKPLLIGKLGMRFKTKLLGKTNTLQIG